MCSRKGTQLGEARRRVAEAVAGQHAEQERELETAHRLSLGRKSYEGVTFFERQVTDKRESLVVAQVWSCTAIGRSKPWTAGPSSPGVLRYRRQQRLREFLKQKNPLAAKRAGEAILRSVRRLGQHPQIGRPAGDMPPEFRDWLIDFGDSGYVALYRFDSVEIVILALRHQKEAG